MNIHDALAFGTRLLAGEASLVRGDTPRLDAEVLLSHVTGLERAALLAHPERELTVEEEACYRALLARRAQAEPVAYLTGHKEFMGLDFLVDRRALIPRPETELLVERALHLLPSEGAGRTAVDVGTGCGAIALSLARYRPRLRVIATEMSAEALALAAENARRLGLRAKGYGADDQAFGRSGIRAPRGASDPEVSAPERPCTPPLPQFPAPSPQPPAGEVEFRLGDLLEPVDEPVDLIAANLPYIPRHELATLPPTVARYEPREAIDGGEGGLEPHRRLFAQLEARPRLLTPGAALLFECDPHNAAELAALCRAHLPNAAVTIGKDLAGLDRIVVAQRHA